MKKQLYLLVVVCVALLNASPPLFAHEGLDERSPMLRDTDELFLRANIPSRVNTVTTPEQIDDLRIRKSIGAISAEIDKQMIMEGMLDAQGQYKPGVKKVLKINGFDQKWLARIASGKPLTAKESEKIMYDQKSLALMVYLATPKDMGGGGLEHIRVQDFLKVRNDDHSHEGKNDDNISQHKFGKAVDVTEINYVICEKRSTGETVKLPVQVVWQVSGGSGGSPFDPVFGNIGGGVIQENPGLADINTALGDIISKSVKNKFTPRVLMALNLDQENMYLFDKNDALFSNLGQGVITKLLGLAPTTLFNGNLGGLATNIEEDLDLPSDIGSITSKYLGRSHFKTSEELYNAISNSRNKNKLFEEIGASRFAEDFLNIAGDDYRNSFINQTGQVSVSSLALARERLGDQIGVAASNALSNDELTTLLKGKVSGRIAEIVDLGLIEMETGLPSGALIEYLTNSNQHQIEPDDLDSLFGLNTGTFEQLSRSGNFYQGFTGAVSQSVRNRIGTNSQVMTERLAENLAKRGINFNDDELALLLGTTTRDTMSALASKQRREIEQLLQNPDRNTNGENDLLKKELLRSLGKKPPYNLNEPINLGQLTDSYLVGRLGRQTILQTFINKANDIDKSITQADGLFDQFNRQYSDINRIYRAFDAGELDLSQAIFAADEILASGELGEFTASIDQALGLPNGSTQLLVQYAITQNPAYLAAFLLGFAGIYDLDCPDLQKEAQKNIALLLKRSAELGEHSARLIPSQLITYPNQLLEEIQDVIDRNYFVCDTIKQARCGLFEDRNYPEKIHIGF